MRPAPRTAAATRTHAFEKNEPRFDAHTPSRAYALSDEASERIRRKVEAALAARSERLLNGDKAEDQAEEERKRRPQRQKRPQCAQQAPGTGGAGKDGGCQSCRAAPATTAAARRKSRQQQK